MSTRRMSPAQEAAVAEEELPLGYVSGVFGYKGEVRLFLYNRESDVFAGEGITVTLIDAEGVRVSRHLRTRSGAGKRIIGRVDGVRDEATARSLTDQEIVIEKDALPAPEDGEYYHHQLIGLPVREASGTELGTLQEIVAGHEVDIWVVRGSDGEQMIPAVREAIESVDLDTGVVIADGWLA